MSIKAVIFDLDGTLLNTLEDLAAALNYAMDAYGYPHRSNAEVRDFVGNGVTGLIELAIPNGRGNPQFDEIVRLYRSYYAGHCQIMTRPYDGVMELLKNLDARGIKLAIASNKPDGAVKSLNEFYFADYVEVAMGECPGVPRKPSPEILHNALRELGVTGQESLYVGDSEVDIQTARNAGVKCVSVSWGFRDVDVLKANNAEFIADTPAEILNLID